jgi:hypothetical protein
MVGRFPELARNLMAAGACGRGGSYLMMDRKERERRERCPERDTVPKDASNDLLPPLLPARPAPPVQEVEMG